MQLDEQHENDFPKVFHLIKDVHYGFKIPVPLVAMELVVATASFHKRFQARAIGLRISYQVAP